MGIAFVCALVLFLSERPTMSPDGRFYKERPNLRPYCMRKLYPWLLRKAPFEAWRVFGLVLLAASGAFVGLTYGPWASVLFMGLPLVRCCFRFPVLTDAPALFMFCLGLYLKNPWIMAAGGLFNEKVPIFGAVALWSPLPLIGLIPPAYLYVRGEKPASTDPEWLRHPVKAAWKLRTRLLDTNLTILPWGTLLFGIGGLGAKGSLALLLSYAQLLVAQDGARLYQWAFFALMPGMPQEYLPALAVIHWANPWKTTI